MAVSRSPRHLRSPREIEAMRKAGLIVWEGLKRIQPLVQPGTPTLTIDQELEKHFQERKAEPLFKNYPNAERNMPPFPAVACISLNEEVVHGIPSARVLQEGDIVSIDTGCRFEGWCGDSALTWGVGTISPVNQKLIDVTRGVLLLAIELMGKKDYWSEVAGEMETFVKSNGFSVVENFVGHGIGRNMHEEPQVPNYLDRRLLRNNNFRLEEGLVIAVEPMVNVGTKNVEVGRDSWTVLTRDRMPSAHFEHTIAITADGPRVLTSGPEGEIAW